jgi:fucose permease
MVAAGLVSGAGNGAMHVGLNTHFAANHGVGAVNGLHACFGIGATLGPLVMTAILRAGSSWRWGYGAAGLIMGLVALYFAITHNRWSGSAEKAAGENQSGGRSSLETLSLPIVWVSVLVFFVYTGVESTAGQWVYSLFTEARSVTESTAGFWVTVYWGGLAAGRVMLGRVVDQFEVVSVLRLCILGVVVGAALIWWHPTDMLSFLGLALIGVAEGPIFPSLVSGTSRRVAAGHVDNTIGFEVTAASLGVAALSSLAGVLAARRSLEVIGPFLAGCAVVMFLLHEIVVRHEKNPVA